MRLFKLAWRNTWRNRRRTIISMASIVFAVFIVTLTDALQGGTFDMMEKVAVRLFTGDLQVHRAGYQDEPTLTLSLTNHEVTWDQLLGDQPWVDSFSRRLTNFGLVSSDSSSTGAMIIGVEPEKEQKVSTFTRKITSGQPLVSSDGKSVLIGASMAENLQLDIGDSLVVLSQGYQGAPSYGLYAVKGMIKTGSVEFDRAVVIMTLPVAQELFWMPDRFSEMVVTTSNFRTASDFSRRLSKDLHGPEFEVMGWEEIVPEMKQTRSFKQIGSRVFFLFLLIVIGFELFNTSSMSVIERMKEFGVLQALGMNPASVGLLVFLEGMIKVVIALVIGFLLSYGLISAFGDQVIPLSADLQELYAEMGFNIEGFTFSRRMDIFLVPVVSVAFISVISIIYPVIRAVRLRPVEALRFV